MKKVLIDLSFLENIYSGLGQIALSYGNYFKKNYNRKTSGYQLYLLMPKNMFGMFGSDVKYINSHNWFRRHSRFLFPKVDVWHATNQLSRFKPYSSKTNYILTIHDLNYLYEKNGKPLEKSHYRMQRKVNRATQIVCISEFAKKDVEQNLSLKGKSCKMIYNQVKRLDELQSQKPKIEIQQPFFFSIGLLAKKKNFHVLFDLMKLMPDKHLYIAGKSLDKSPDAYAIILEKQLKDEKINNVTFIGEISHGEKIWMYQNCEAFLFPSLLEGFGLPIIEAMQFGKPVFSSKETSLKEIGSSYAYFWNNFEPNYMKSVIDNNLEKFYADKQIADIQKQYADSFDSDTHFIEYEKLYLSDKE